MFTLLILFAAIMLVSVMPLWAVYVLAIFGVFSLLRMFMWMMEK